MTLYFSQNSKLQFSLDGDWRGVNLANPGGYVHTAIRLISKYNNKAEIQSPGLGVFYWLFDLDLVQANERYTEFSATQSQTDKIATEFRTGLYKYELYGTYIDVEGPTAGDFKADQWQLLRTGECKAKTETTNDMQRSTRPETIKYTTEPNTAQSYIIYN